MKILSVNISEKKGTTKKPVPEITLNDNGIKEDAHAGGWHRQVSLLGKESFEKFSKKANRTLVYGEFAENITTEGLVLYETLPLDRLVGREVELEITQIGKECHGSGCAIFHEVGSCVMPKEGIFARVIKGGTVTAGDQFYYQPKIFRFLVITLSDRASRGEYADLSGPRIVEILNTHFSKTKRKIDIKQELIPDSTEQLSDLVAYAVSMQFDAIITTGGTGVGPRDITVETIKPMLHKEISGIMEMIRMKYGASKPNALLSSGVAGLIDNTLVYTLPGSVKAVNEYMEEILKTLQHLVYMRHGIDAH